MKNRDVETKRRRDEVRANFISLRLYVSSSLRLFFAALAILPFTSGCVLFQIRDELRHVNQQMTQINSSLQEVNQKLGTSGESEAGVNKSMQTIQVSLHRIDDELAALLQMMEKIGNLVPGVHINPDTSVPPPQAPATTQNQ